MNQERANNPEDAVFLVRNLTKVYKMGEVEVHALRGADLELYSGEMVVFLGPSGSGKSTLLNTITGSLPIDSGKIVLDNINITRSPAHRRAAERRERQALRRAPPGRRVIAAQRAACSSS